ncbi:MAG: type II secretion system protein [Planctomycetota bacterium]|nr:type II secretion system protein [Planctomycetota bacterium]
MLADPHQNQNHERRHAVPSCHARRISSPAGFTLIELLVCVAIISLLVATLMPAIVGGRVESQRVGCLNNERQIALAFSNYIHDYNLAYPYWDCAQTPMAVGTYNNWGAAYAVSWQMAIRYYIGNSNYTGNDKIPYYRCPANPWEPWATNAQYAPAATYGMNSSTFPQSYGSTSAGDPATNPAWYFETRKEYQLKRPSMNALLGDVPSGNNTVTGGLDYTRNTIDETPLRTDNIVYYPGMWNTPDINKYARLNHHIPGNYAMEKMSWNIVMCDGSAKSYNMTQSQKLANQATGLTAYSDGLMFWSNRYK